MEKDTFQSYLREEIKNLKYISKASSRVQIFKEKIIKF